MRIASNQLIYFVLENVYSESSDEDKEKVYNILVGESEAPMFTGDMVVENGKVVSEVTIIHARSFAEDVAIYQNDKLFTGSIGFTDGKPNDINNYTIKGKSLLHSAALTTEAFKSSIFGDFGQYIVSIGLLLFAFSTAISWSYYGDRATTYLFGPKAIIFYRIFYVAGFFVASFADTTIVWTFSELAIALMDYT